MSDEVVGKFNPGLAGMLVPLSDLREDPRNPRTHDDRNVQAIAASLDAYRQQKPINALRDGTVLAGNGTLRAARSLGWTHLAVVRFDSEVEAEATGYKVADNRTAELAEWDDGLLAEDLSSLRDDDIDLGALGWDEPELDALWEAAGLAEEPREAPEPQIDRAEELREKWQTERGQLWVIPGKAGEHRLLCGDSTKAEDVGRVLSKVVPFMMVTDPPYGVEYDPAWREEYDAFERHSTGKVPNDDRADWTEAYLLFSGDVAYTWSPGGDHVIITGRSLQKAGFQLRSQLIWRKQHFVFGRGAYHWQHEPCWYGVRKGKAAKWCGDRKQPTVWDIQNKNPMGGKIDDANTTHGTQKPLECMARPIRNHGATGDGVYDPFLGSGTTMVAAEQLRRVCYGIEIEPKYVAVSLQRLADMGLIPRLADP